MHWWTGAQTFILCSPAISPSNALTFTHTSWHPIVQTFGYQFLHKCTHTCTSARSLTHTHTAWNTWVYPRHKNSCSPHDTDANVPTYKFSSVHFWSVATCQQPNTLHPTPRCQSAAPSMSWLQNDDPRFRASDDDKLVTLCSYERDETMNELFQ